MSKFKATFLGTGTSQGVPVIACDCKVCKSADPKDTRLRTSIMLSIGDKNIVIDTGPDFRQQMLLNDVKMVDAIIYTHEHKDHISGMDDIRSYNYQSKGAMEIFASTQVQEALKREYAYVFADNPYPGIPQVKLNTIDSEPICLFGEEILPIAVMHYKMPVKAFRLGSLTYITDANFIEDKEIEKIKGSEILIINALRKEPHISHFNLKEALEFIEIIKPKKAYLIHISHLMGTHHSVSLELPANVEIAYDGLQIEFE